MSEKDSPRELSSEESQRFSEQIAELGLEDKLITSEQLYRERTAVFYESLEQVTTERTGRSCHASLKEIDASSAFFRNLVRDMTQTLEGAERSETVVNMLAGFQTECVQAVNALAQTQFSPNVNAEQHRYTKHKLLRVDDGGNLPISMEASHIHRLIARKHAYLLASECGLDGVFKREQMKYDLAQTVKKVF